MNKKLKILAAIAMMAGATSVHAQDAAPGSANDITKQIQKDSTAGINPGTDQGINIPDRTDSSLSSKVQRDGAAVREGTPSPTDQGPVMQAPVGTAHPKALPGQGNVPSGG